MTDEDLEARARAWLALHQTLDVPITVATLVPLLLSVRDEASEVERGAVVARIVAWLRERREMTYTDAMADAIERHEAEREKVTP